ncbi:CbtA family protein [Nocardioides sp. CN2-186]|uniref:CbtA family protein n=1 Tax=Nocardioides tweenelious TaxID=3156607 RepID=UPI0032B3819C
MEKQLIGRGVLAGALGGLVAFIFARIFAEPLIQRAIDYEGARDAAQEALDKAAGIAVPAAGPDIFSRSVQADVGIGVGLILMGAAMGALVAVAYVICIGRTGAVRPFQLALLVPAFFFVGVYLVPFARYPANPPAIGHEETIRDRGASYLVLVFLSCLFLFLAVYVGQKLHRRHSLYATSILMGLAYVAVMAIVFAILPSYDEVPQAMTGPDGTIVLAGFPADLLAEFRVYSIAAQAIMWGVIALTFAPLAERVVDPTTAQRRKETRAPAPVSA